MIFREINYDIHEIRIRWYINKEDLVNKNEFMKSDCKKTEIKNSPEHQGNKYLPGNGTKRQRDEKGIEEKA